MFRVVMNLRSLNGTSALLYSMALAFEIMGLSDKALVMFNRALKQSPHNRWLRLHASRLYLKKGQVDKAVTYWKKAAGPEDFGCLIYWLNKSRGLPALYKPKIFQHLSLENDGSIPAFARKTIPEPAPREPGLEMLEKGMALSKLDRHEEAVAYYEKAQEAGLNNLELLNNKGHSLFNLARYDEAQTCYELARGIFSRNLDSASRTA